MSALSIQPTYPIFTETDGQPLENGYIWIGTANLDPQGNPINVYWDAALTQLAGQPIRTQGGYPVNSGTPARLYVNSDYSIRVQNSTGSLVYSAPSATERYSGVVVSVNAENVVYDPPFTGSTSTNVEAKLAQTVSIKDFGAVGDGVTNDTDAFEDAIAAIATTGQTLYVPAGTYKLTREIATTGDLIIEGDGDSTVLDFSGTVTGGTGKALSVSGSFTALPDLSTNASKNDQSLVFVSAPSLSVTDVLVIYNPTDFSYSGFRFYYRAGEWCEVDGVSGSTVSLTNSLYDGYVAGAVDLYKLSSPTVSLRNFRIIGTTVESLITISLCNRPLVENVSGYLENNWIVSFDRCYKPTAINLNLFNKGDGGDDYGLVITNSQDVEVIGGNYYARRHAITTGGAADVGAVPCRNLRFTSLTTKNDINSGVFSADFHGNTEDSVYENCRIYGGATWQGKNNRYVNCVISDIFSYVCVYSAEIKGGYFTLENCDLLVTGDPQPNTRGIIDIGGNNAAVTANTTERTTFIVKNCRVFAPNAGSATSLVLFKNQGCVQYVNFDIDGITALSTTSFGQILYTDNTSGTAASEFIVVDGITGFPTGTYLHNPNGNHYANFPHRCQKQTGRVTLAATSGTNNTIASNILFKYPYPRVPASFATSGGTTAQTFIGNRAAIANLYQVDNDSIRPQIFTGDAANWSATLDVSVSWSAMIDEV